MYNQEVNTVPSDSELIRITRKGCGYPGFLMRNYRIGDPPTSMAEIIVSGRYPEKGMAMNEQCEMSFFVKQGSGFIVTENDRRRFSTRDVVRVERFETFCIEPEKIPGRGYEDASSSNQIITLIASFSPAWTDEQHQIVE